MKSSIGNYRQTHVLIAKMVSLPEAVADLYRVVAKLDSRYAHHKRKFTPDGHLLGSIGEVVAAEEFGLELLPNSHEGHDARDASGTYVQIKITGGNRVAMYGKPDRLIVLKIVSAEHAEVVFDGSGDQVWKQVENKKAKNGQHSISLTALRKMVRGQSDSKD